MNLERLYFLREEKDLTQDDIGVILGVSKSAISKWENGKEIIPSNLSYRSFYFCTLRNKKISYFNFTCLFTM